jgi:ribosomal protein L29
MAKKPAAIDASLSALAGKLIEQLGAPIGAEDDILIVTGAAVLVPEARMLTPLKDQTILFYESASTIAEEVLTADPSAQHIGASFLSDEDRMPANIILGVVLTVVDNFGELVDNLHANLLPGGSLGLIVHPDNLAEPVLDPALAATVIDASSEGGQAYSLLTIRAFTDEELAAQEADEASPKHTRNDFKSIVHHYSAEEIYELSKQLASKNQDLASLRLEKSASASNYASRIKDVEKEISDLSTKVANGNEVKDVKVQIVYNDPEVGFKSTKRLDIEDAKPTVERMDYEEKQRYAPTLFDTANLTM